MEVFWLVRGRFDERPVSRSGGCFPEQGVGNREVLAFNVSGLIAAFEPGTPCLKGDNAKGIGR